jgi:hypothetical protein
MPLTWFPLQPRGSKSKGKLCGEILLTVSLYGRENYNRFLHQEAGLPRYVITEGLSSRELTEPIETPKRISNSSLSSFGSGVSEEASSVHEDKMNTPSLAGRFLVMFTNKNAETTNQIERKQNGARLKTKGRQI